MHDQKRKRKRGVQKADTAFADRCRSDRTYTDLSTDRSFGMADDDPFDDRCIQALRGRCLHAQKGIRLRLFDRLGFLFCDLSLVCQSLSAGFCGNG